MKKLLTILIIFLSYLNCDAQCNSILEISKTLGIGYSFDLSSIRHKEIASSPSYKAYNILYDKSFLDFKPKDVDIMLFNNRLQYVRFVYDSVEGIEISLKILSCLKEYSKMVKTEQYVAHVYTDKNLSICTLMYGSSQFDVIVYDNIATGIEF